MRITRQVKIWASNLLNKVALIYIASKNMGFEPEGMTDAQMQELTDTFGLPK